MNKELKTTIVGLIVVLLIGGGVWFYRNYLSPSQIQVQGMKTNSQEKNNQSASQVVVHIDGAVMKVGVYRLNSGDRILDAIAQAGGAYLDADLSSMNLAEKLKDGQKIFIPRKIKEQNQTAKTGLISINYAKAEDFDSLPGVGPTTAQKIIEHRKQNGPFLKLEDLMKIKTIGKSKYEKIKSMIRL